MGLQPEENPLFRRPTQDQYNYLREQYAALLTENQELKDLVHKTATAFNTVKDLLGIKDGENINIGKIGLSLTTIIMKLKKQPDLFSFIHDPEFNRLLKKYAHDPTTNN